MTRLVLPIAGQATRIGGIPKFILPVSEKQTLIGEHILSAFESGIKSVVIICRKIHTEITRNVLAEFEDFVEYVEIDFKTKTMNETLTYFKPYDDESEVIVGLADSFWSANQLTAVYKYLGESKDSDGCLALFPMRDTQIGKLGAVEIDSHFNVISMADKDPNTNLTLAWGALKIPTKIIKEIDPDLPHVGHSVNLSISAGHKYSARIFNTNYFDCGTFSEYMECLNGIHK